jgi:hypothetical protein
MAVIGHHASGFLSPVLQGMQAKRCMGCGIRMAVYTKNTTFIAEVIVVTVKGYCHGAFGHKIFKYRLAL